MVGGPGPCNAGAKADKGNVKTPQLRPPPHKKPKMTLFALLISITQKIKPQMFLAVGESNSTAHLHRGPDSR